MQLLSVVITLCSLILNGLRIITVGKQRGRSSPVATRFRDWLVAFDVVWSKVAGVFVMNAAMRNLNRSAAAFFLFLSFCVGPALGNDDEVRVFIFAGQSNMVGSDSKVQDIHRFPPFADLETAQSSVRFSYCIGRENKTQSNGWVDLQPVNNIVGPELSFAREVTKNTEGPIAIIKVAAGGTHLGGDWNPDEPIGFKMYPLALQKVRDALTDLDKQGVKYRIEGFMWHQGENDMFDPGYMATYGNNLKNFLASWRRDLQAPDLRFYIGELCTKTIWGMDLRPRMHAISLGQKEVTTEDPLATYVATSHVGVEIGGGVGLHYHYGTLGQLQHGINYAEAYLNAIGRQKPVVRTLQNWPYKPSSPVKLFVLAGHRNMEGERCFVQDVANAGTDAGLLNDNSAIAYKYSLGGGYRISNGWEPLGPVQFYDTFGPELSFAQTLQDKGIGNIAIAKFTHSGSQIIDWTPEGSEAVSRNMYPSFLKFVQSSIDELQLKGHSVELAGIFYHVGENDMSWGPFRQAAPQRVTSLTAQSRIDLALPNLRWYVSQQPPTDNEQVNKIDVTSKLQDVLAADENTTHIKAFDLPPQEKQLVINSAGIVELGRTMANEYLRVQRGGN